LQRAFNDAEAVGNTLQALGFQVTHITREATLTTFLNRFGEFASTSMAAPTTWTP
jgi:hypothetical protein